MTKQTITITFESDAPASALEEIAGRMATQLEFLDEPPTPFVDEPDIEELELGGYEYADVEVTINGEGVKTGCTHEKK